MIHDLTTEELSQLICDHRSDIANTISALVMDLIDAGNIRIHRNWSQAEERRTIAKAAADAAVRAVLESDWCDLPPEVRFLHLGKAFA